MGVGQRFFVLVQMALQLLDKQLTCTVCSELFKDPRQLNNCQDSFCLNCINGFTKIEKVQCPRQAVVYYCTCLTALTHTKWPPVTQCDNYPHTLHTCCTVYMYTCIYIIIQYRDCLVQFL